MQVVLAPEGSHPTHLLEEYAHCDASAGAAAFLRRRTTLAHATLAWENASFSPVGSLVLAMFGPFSAARLLLMGFNPGALQSAKNRWNNAVLHPPRTQFDPPFLAPEAAALLASTFGDIGMRDRFAPLVVVLGHGAQSVNNPFASAYNCGACGGRDGGPNARVFAALANDEVPHPRMHARICVSDISISGVSKFNAFVTSIEKMRH